MFASKQLPADGETARPVPRVGSVNHCPHLSWIEWAAIATVSISALGVLAVLAHRFWTYTLDDAYISFRYAQNLLDGDGLVFNAGEFPRSEGITSPLWAFVMASGLAVSIDALLLAKTMGVAAAIFTAVTIVAAVSKILRRTSTLSTRTSCAFGIVAAASFVISPYVVVNSVSGMETSLAVAAYAAFLLRTVGTVELATRRSSAAITGVFAVIVPMLRPEMGLAVVVTLFATLVLWRASRPYIATSLATFVGLGLAYFFVRFAYYGLPLPLPFYIKQGGSAAPGWTDLQGFLKYSVVLGLLSTVAAGFAAYALSRKRGNAMLATLLAISVGAIAQLAYYATIHHIMGFGFRYFMPVLAALTITAGVGAGLVCARITTRTGPQAIAITGFVAHRSGRRTSRRTRLPGSTVAEHHLRSRRDRSCR